MSDELFNMFLYIIAGCYVIAVALFISKKVALKGSCKVYGQVIDIIQQYRSAKYTVEIIDDGTSIYQTFNKRSNLFNSIGMHSSVTFYKIETPDGYKYKRVNAYYGYVWALLILPWVVLFSFAIDSEIYS